MKTCQDWELDISAYLDGALSGEEQSALLSHLGGCPICQQYLDDQLAIREALRALESLPAPAGLAERVMEQVRESTPRETARKAAVRFPRWQRWAALAACCAVAALGVWRFQGGGESASMDTAAPLLQSAAQEAAPELRFFGADAGGAAPASEPAGSPAEGRAEEDGAPAGTPEAALCDEADASAGGGVSAQKASSEASVTLEEARERFGHALADCGDSRFLYCTLETGEDGQYTRAVYVFTFGEIAVVDQAAAPLPDAGEWDSLAWDGRELRLHSAETETTLLHQPSGEEGLAYLARFDGSAEREDVAALLLALEIA